MTDGRDDELYADRAFRPGPPPALREPPRRSRVLGLLVATFALAAFGGVVWYAYDQGLRRGTEVTAPLIKADPNPTKLRPEQPGGLQVPNQDKLVYEAMRPGDGDVPRVERLLPPPERPVDPPAPPPPPPIPQLAPAAEAPVPAPQEQTGPAPADPAASEAGIPPARIVTPAPAPSIPKPEDTPAPPATVPTPAAPPVPAKPAAPPPAPAAEKPVDPKPADPKPAPVAAPAPAKPPAAGAFRIQLGAVREAAAAEAEWNRLKRRYPEQLDGLSHRIQSVDLGAGKGVFHRIQSSGVSEASANAICAGLKARSQPCIVVKP